jgi:hypothetical protein
MKREPKKQANMALVESDIFSSFSCKLLRRNCAAFAPKIGGGLKISRVGESPQLSIAIRSREQREAESCGGNPEIRHGLRQPPHGAVCVQRAHHCHGPRPEHQPPDNWIVSTHGSHLYSKRATQKISAP